MSCLSVSGCGIAIDVGVVYWSILEEGEEFGIILDLGWDRTVIVWQMNIVSVEGQWRKVYEHDNEVPASDQIDK